MFRRAALQAYFLALHLFNLTLSVSTFFGLRHGLLRLAGNKIGAGAAVHRRLKLFAFKGLSIGNNSTINEGCYLDARRGITIGANVSIAHDTKIYTLGHEIDGTGFASKGAPVTIGDYVCIFAGVLIMPGIRIGDRAVIYPGSVVVKDVPDGAVAGGNPARVLRQREGTSAYQISYRYWFGH